MTNQCQRVSFFRNRKKALVKLEPVPPDWLYSSLRRVRTRMLVERGTRVIDTEVVGDAYAIASNYLRRSGAMADNFVTNDRLLSIIVHMFHAGEVNKLKLANKA